MLFDNRCEFNIVENKQIVETTEIRGKRDIKYMNFQYCLKANVLSSLNSVSFR